MIKHKPNKLGIKVKNKLNKLNMTQKQLANEIGISAQMLSAVLRGSTSSVLLEEWLDDWCNDRDIPKYNKNNRNERK